jgi:RHS repeat-associated core domain
MSVAKAAGLLLAMACLLASFVASAQTVTYIHTDALGSVVAESDASGNVIKRYAYEPYGAAIGEGVVDGPGYTGHVSDSVTGLSYMQQRYYDPTIGRFLSVDPVTAYSGDQKYFNRYWYAAANPYKFTDPDGRKLVIEGDKEFKREVKAQIRELKATPTGKQIVVALQKSKETFTITKNDGSSHANPTNLDNAQNGQGTGGTIAHDTKWTPTVSTTEGTSATPSKVVLGHELSHAVDYSKGTLDRSVNPGTGVRRSEEKAMGVENQIRREMNLPERTVY